MSNKSNEGVLLQRGDSDYQLKEKAGSCWVEVDGFAIYICRTDEGVVVDIYESGSEMDESLAGCYAFTNELGSDNEE